MPAPTRSPTGTPHDSSDEDVLRTLLPLVIEAATKSAEGATASALATRALEVHILELKGEIKGNTTAVAKLTEAHTASTVQQGERAAWFRTLFQPQYLFPFALQILVLLLGLMGIKSSMPDEGKLLRALVEIQAKAAVKTEEEGGEK